MNTLAKALGKHFPEIPCQPDPTRPHPHTSVGIEVELENVPQDLPDGKRWHVYTNEGSIINGVEFISHPVWGTGITDALEELEQIMTDLEAPRITRRCSVHIHVNMLDLDLASIAHLTDLYTVYERPLFRLHAAWDRENNPFCIPAYKSDSLRRNYSQLTKDLRSSQGLIRPSYVGTKYAAMNPNNLRTLGTLEFRHMGGSVDIQEMDEWINLLLQLKTAAQQQIPLDQPALVWGPYADKIANLSQPTDLQDGLEIVNNYTLWR